MGRLTQAAVNFTGMKQAGNTTPGGSNTNEIATEDEFVWREHEIVSTTVRNVSSYAI